MIRWLGVTLCLVGLLVGCASGPPVPDWTLAAHSAMQQTLDAALTGRQRIEVATFQRARTEIARSGRPDLLARVELMRCAAHVARLEGGDCPGFDALRPDAAVGDRAYADYLVGRLAPDDLPLLPPAHQAAARGDVAAVVVIGDPLTRLVAAATLLQAGRAGPAVVTVAVDTASAQGWGRALLPWLQVQQRQAQAAGDGAESDRLQRRIDTVQLGLAR